MEWLIWIMFFITVIALSGMGLGFIDGRRKYKLELKKEDRRLLEAETEQLQEQNKRAELEYRQAKLELERFDRHADPAGGLAARPVSAPPAPEPPALRDPVEPR